MVRNRRLELRNSTTLNGIDFVEIASPDQRTLRVHFLNAVPVEGTITAVTITGGDKIAEITPEPIEAADWSSGTDGNFVLTLRVPVAGDFSYYVLTIESPALDIWFKRSVFSFKALCDSPLDCRTPEPECPGPEPAPIPISYLAKDYLSFKQALTDFSATRYPDWKERSEGDFGMMFLEALSALGDELSYTQDRYAAESSLETATQRRSLVRHARIVDYEPRPATSARVLLHFSMTTDATVAAGSAVSAAQPDGSSILFETGTGLDDETAPCARTAWNRMEPWWFDDSERCLPRGSTEMWVQGSGLELCAGQQLLIETAGATSADPPVCQVVRLATPPTPDAEEAVDPLFGNQPITRIVWIADDALTVDRDLTRTVVRGNLVPATQGQRFIETFAVEPAPASPASMPLAVNRTGPNGAPVAYFTLRETPVAWLAPDDVSLYPVPEVRATEQPSNASPRTWTWVRKLIDAGRFDRAYTLDPMRFSRIGRNSDGSQQYEYDGDNGDTVRFGDATFGNPPEDGTVFEVVYRVGAGSAGNVAPESSWRIEAAIPASFATNPFAAFGGADAETAHAVRSNAPQAFRAEQFRAVIRQDYEDAAETLPWVQRAGCAFRWTGSWLTVFTTPDPEGGQPLRSEQHLELIELLNRYRMAGYEAYVPPPRYAPIDLSVRVCARSDAFRADVYEALVTALSTRKFLDGSTGFFHPDRFTFGQTLERSVLEAAIQNVHGVGGVLSIVYRRRGITASFVPLPDRLTVGIDEIITLDNDPTRPERGSLKLKVEGGK